MIIFTSLAGERAGVIALRSRSSFLRLAPADDTGRSSTRAISCIAQTFSMKEERAPSKPRKHVVNEAFYARELALAGVGLAYSFSSFGESDQHGVKSNIFVRRLAPRLSATEGRPPSMAVGRDGRI
jgi:hypothetical protein